MTVHCYKLDNHRSKIILQLDECFQVKLVLTADEIEALEGHLLDMQVKLSNHRRNCHPEQETIE